MGVPLAALTVFTYQGSLTLIAAYPGGFPTEPMIGDRRSADHGAGRYPPGDKEVTGSQLSASVIDRSSGSSHPGGDRGKFLKDRSIGKGVDDD
jgi:hypothetical protein